MKEQRPNYVYRIILDDVTDQAMEISTDMELSDIKVPKTFEEADSSIHRLIRSIGVSRSLAFERLFHLLNYRTLVVRNDSLPLHGV